MCDKLVFDLAQEVEGSPNVFVRKDWINILDNQNQNYNNNQSVVDTSQLSNSNKYMSYREAYFSIPFVVTLATTSTTVSDGANTPRLIDPSVTAGSLDSAVGLKNWFGQIIHSFTLDYNGTTIVQQTPFINMWNSFKLMTSLSLDDINTQGATIGFYPDDATSWQFAPAGVGAGGVGVLYGNGICNNTNYIQPTLVTGAFNNFNSGRGNSGLLQRQQLINFDTDGIPGASTYGTLLQGSATALTNVWKNYIFNKRAQTSATVPEEQALIQFGIVATVYLKHIHSFFNMCPLLKGVFMKMTMNLNNTTTVFKTLGNNAAGGALTPTALTCVSVANSLGGVNPLMIASGSANNGGVRLFSTASPGPNVGTQTINYRMNISVGARCLDSILTQIRPIESPLSKSIYLYIPAYTFNPVFEQAYLSSPVKQIKYTDVYQYQVLNVASQSNFNNLLTNGIANVKSVLILPIYSTNGATLPAVTTDGVACSTNTGFVDGSPVFQSPFDPAGTGPTSPLCLINNFNIQVSGQNAIYNVQRYNFEQFNNQLYGQNAVNGGLTDGLTSGLIDRQRFDMEYSYYYVNVERMLPVEMSVPKSIQLLGQNQSSRVLDLYCFVEYGLSISIDALSGARV
jgi:hypothetical protein